jgi:hypothetical protein
MSSVISNLHCVAGTAQQIGVEIEIFYRGFHARGAVLLSEFVDGFKDDTEHGNKSPARICGVVTKRAIC